MEKVVRSIKVVIRTMGCQMNVRDSEVIKGLLALEGFQLTDDLQSADVVLFNTCSVRKHAEEKVWSELGRFSPNRRYPDNRRQPDHKDPFTAKKMATARPIIGVIGCMAQNYKEQIRKRAPYVDIICGPSEIDNIALYVQEACRHKKKVCAVSVRRRQEKIYHTGFYDSAEHAYVVISEGCDNFCSYCVVPYVRGRLRHRRAKDILREIQALVDRGINNITLLGQNVNAYKSPASGDETQIDFVDLLKKIGDTMPLKSLTFLTSHPKDVTKRVFEAMRDIPIIKRSLHMPFQSGSDRILRLMKRGYSVKKYRQLVDDYRAIVYNGQLSTDVIVGFPGETEEDFQATRGLMAQVRFDKAFIFKYSSRPHTSAAALPDDVPQEVKQRRNNDLLALQRTISRDKKNIHL